MRIIFFFSWLGLGREAALGSTGWVSSISVRERERGQEEEKQKTEKGGMKRGRETSTWYMYI